MDGGDAFSKDRQMDGGRGKSTRVLRVLENRIAERRGAPAIFGMVAK